MNAAWVVDKENGSGIANPYDIEIITVELNADKSRFVITGIDFSEENNPFNKWINTSAFGVSHLFINDTTTSSEYNIFEYFSFSSRSVPIHIDRSAGIIEINIERYDMHKIMHYSKEVVKVQNIGEAMPFTKYDGTNKGYFVQINNPRSASLSDPIKIDKSYQWWFWENRKYQTTSNYLDFDGGADTDGIGYWDSREYREIYRVFSDSTMGLI